MATERLVITQNVTNGAIAQWSAFPFNSFARVGDKNLAFNEDGLFLLGGDLDNPVSHPNSDIAAYFEIFIDFGQTVRLRSLWLGYETSGSCQLTLTIDDRTTDARTFTLTPLLVANRQHGTKLYLSPANDKGQYLRLRFANTDGADFSLDEITALIIPLGHRREGQ